MTNWSTGTGLTFEDTQCAYLGRFYHFKGKKVL